MGAGSAIVQDRELLSGVRVLTVGHSLRILAIIEGVLDMCAVAKRLDRRCPATAQGDDRRDDQLLTEPVGDGGCVRHDVRTVPLWPYSLRPRWRDCAKALDARGNVRRRT